MAIEGGILTAQDVHRPPANQNHRLVTLGRLALLRPSGEELSLVGHKRNLALLAVLALSPGPLRRDELIALFWGDEKDTRSGRHSLSNALSFLRGIIGSNAITAHRADIELAPDAISVDAVELLAAAHARDFARVIDLYHGPFMDGVAVSGSEAFAGWSARQRDVIVRTVVSACDIQCSATAAAREWNACADTARIWLDADLHSSTAALHLLNSTRATGTPEAGAAALAEYDRIVERLALDGGAMPDARVTELAHRIQARVVTAKVVRQVHQQPVAASSDTEVASEVTAQIAPQASQPQNVLERPRQRWNLRRWVIAAAVAASIVALGAFGYLRTRTPVRTRPLIAVTDIANVRGDTASAWLEDGLLQMITGDLTRNSNVETITPVRMRTTRARARLPLHGALSDKDALDLGRRLGASLIVRGGFTHGNGVYVLDISARDAITGRSTGSFTVSGADPMTVAGWAAGRLLDLSGVDADKPRFADVETNSIAAYQHFVRALETSSEGRYTASRRELDEAIAIDSGYADALAARADIASAEGDTVTIQRLHRAMTHARLTPWDVAIQAINSAKSNGENTRAADLARALVTQYPHDPRAYATLASVYSSQGRWPEARVTAQQELALDSLANEAGDGPCAPCTAYATLIDIELGAGNLRDAEQSARRWLTLQPDLPVSWAKLGDVLDYGGHYDAALDAYRRAELLGGGIPIYQLRTARAMLTERRISAADSVLASVHSTDRSIRSGIDDLRVLALRERGELRESNALAAAHLITEPRDLAFLLEEMDALGRMGEYTEAARLFDRRIATLGATPAKATMSGSRGDAARWFCWTRALEANAIAGSGDTLRLRALADSIHVISAWSYFARDARLHHHVLGLIAMRGKRYAEAEREFRAARWGVAGWTETEAWLARAQLAQHEPVAAVATLRDAYEGPLDAMGRYEPRSELDSLMSVAFSQAGMADSASVYAGYVASVRGKRGRT